MSPQPHHLALILVVGLTMLSIPAWPQPNIQKIKTDYQAVSAQLQRHLVDDQWIDEDPQSPGLLARQWSLAGEWVAAWLDSRASASPDDVKAAIADLAPSETPAYFALNNTTFLVAAPGPIGNVFIVTKSGGHCRLAWSTGQPQQSTTTKQSEVLAAWRAENARHGGRGPYWAASGRAGPVSPRLGRLPDDAKGHARFYVDGIYAQSAGGTAGAQISLWVWDGGTAHAQIARDYTVMIDQAVGTRLEGDLLKVQQKKPFHAFFSCGGCEGRQTDWIVRITPEGVEEIGERTVVPELDVVDELFDRLIHGRSAADLAAPAALEAAGRIVRAARSVFPDKDWKEFPTLGMMMGWRILKGKKDEVLCFATDDSGSNLFTLRPVGEGGFFVADIRETKGDCEK